MGRFLLTPPGLLHLLAILGLAIASARRRAIAAPATWVLAWVALTIAMLALSGGLGHTWGFWSVVGKLAALGITLAMPLGVAAAVGFWLTRRDAARPWLALAMLASGALAILAVPWTALWLGIIFTGDGP